MDSGSEKKLFFFADEAVGYFEDQPPSSAGKYRYIPFRGPGHFHLVQALATGSQQCFYVVKGEKRLFTVERIPSLHTLEVSG